MNVGELIAELAKFPLGASVNLVSEAGQVNVLARSVYEHDSVVHIDIEPDEGNEQ